MYKLSNSNNSIQISNNISDPPKLPKYTFVTVCLITEGFPMKRKYNRATEKFMRSSFPTGAIQLFPYSAHCQDFSNWIHYIILIWQCLTSNIYPVEQMSDEAVPFFFYWIVVAVLSIWNKFESEAAIQNTADFLHQVHGVAFESVISKICLITIF